MSTPKISPNDVLSQLFAVVEDRKAKLPEKSYTTELFRGGLERIGGKVTEEAGEVAAAAREPGEAGRAHVIGEAADLIYHLFVLMVARDVCLADVAAELARRFGISGLDEKASRK